MGKRRIALLLTALLSVFVSLSAAADTTEQKEKRVVVAPMVVFSPGFGNGGGLTGMYFYHPSLDGVSPASNVGASALYSHNHSYAVAAFNQSYFMRDTFRLAFGGAYADVKSDLDIPTLGSVEFSSTAYGVAVRPDVRIFGNLFGGITGAYMVTEYKAGNEASKAYFQTYGIDKDKLGSVGTRLVYDSRDNQFFPYDGVFAAAEARLVPSAFGSESTYHTIVCHLNDYERLRPGHVLALRGSGRFTPSDTPYTGLSKLGRRSDLRGYTPGEHVGRNIIATQAEYRWIFARRWGVVAFGGVAALYDGGLKSITSDRVFPGGGAGVRFGLHEENRVNFRVDYARGADDDGLYVSIGEAF
ncbi:MAG: BamA/TamA family outer membrane protein [Candidatus Zixiibacteriota bacterium]|jgi:outer membrane protein assembly factor BamA